MKAFLAALLLGTDAFAGCIAHGTEGDKSSPVQRFEWDRAMVKEECMKPWGPKEKDRCYLKATVFKMPHPYLKGEVEISLMGVVDLKAQDAKTPLTPSQIHRLDGSIRHFIGTQTLGKAQFTVNWLGEELVFSQTLWGQEGSKSASVFFTCNLSK